MIPTIQEVVQVEPGGRLGLVHLCDIGTIAGTGTFAVNGNQGNHGAGGGGGRVPIYYTVR